MEGKKETSIAQRKAIRLSVDDGIDFSSLRFNNETKTFLVAEEGVHRSKSRWSNGGLARKYNGQEKRNDKERKKKRKSERLKTSTRKVRHGRELGRISRIEQ